jgi:hypothetical protein
MERKIKRGRVMEVSRVTEGEEDRGGTEGE